MSKPIFAILLVIAAAGMFVRRAVAEDGAAGWLRYAPLTGHAASECELLPTRIVVLDDALLTRTAGAELARGLGSMCGRRETVSSSPGPEEGSLRVGTLEETARAISGWRAQAQVKAEGYVLDAVPSHGHREWVVAGADPQGALYGAFGLLTRIAEGTGMPAFPLVESPAEQVRWVNQWDNLDGSIERGYAGRSIFFADGHVKSDLARAGQYARLLASVGVNGCTVNNVNADLRMLTPEMIGEVARIADAFRPWGVRLSLSVNLSSPQAVGGLASFDPLDPAVAAWWQRTVDAIYAKIPDFGGFVVKADSEGKPGPSQYGRTPAEAANVLARALKPYGGLVLYRGFVYNQHLDWHDLKADRARAGYDNFHALDGKFDDNVVIQIKHGPIDFQVREPVSPLFAALRHTNEAIELQITQEYTGQQRHLVFLVPMWKTALDTDMRAENRSTPVKEIVEGRSFHRPLGGFVGVANVGLDTNWLAHPLAMANLYGFGRLAWNPDLSSQAIADEWTRLTFGTDPVVDRTIDGMLLRSWNVYEDYTGPLGLGTLTDIIGVHYGPGIESAERNGWGQWIRADHEGVGMDRTVATGTGYIGQYPPELARVYESLASCPDELLLFMHHVPYTHRLHSGKTVIQHIYDSHYTGAEGAAQFVADWETLQGKVDEQRYEKVLALQTYQAGHAIVWRDAVSNWFERMSGIPDAQGRVGHYPDRVEAEAMQLTGYVAVPVTPWETASGGRAIACERSACTATTRFMRPAGSYRIAVAYYDFHDGASKYQLLVNGRQQAQWTADNTLPTDKMNGHTATRFTTRPLRLEPGSIITVEGKPDEGEPAPLDYLAITPDETKKE